LKKNSDWEDKMLYTRKGDGGKSNTLSQKGLRKDTPFFEALGTLDELNSYLGVCKASARNINKNKDDDSSYFVFICEELQQHLFIVQAELAGSDKSVTKAHVERLEKITDSIEKELPPIKSFFLSGTTLLSAHFDYARTLARRAERKVISLEKEIALSEPLRSYMNRLSSVLYALARFSAYKSGANESAPLY